MLTFLLGVLVGLFIAWVWKEARDHSPRHHHEYDHMLGDGKGWRCRICEAPKPKEKR